MQYDHNNTILDDFKALAKKILSCLSGVVHLYSIFGISVAKNTYIYIYCRNFNNNVI